MLGSNAVMILELSAVLKINSGNSAEGLGCYAGLCVSPTLRGPPSEEFTTNFQYQFYSQCGDDDDERCSSCSGQSNPESLPQRL
jgi:hypothetical protein